MVSNRKITVWIQACSNLNLQAKQFFTLREKLHRKLFAAVEIRGKISSNPTEYLKINRQLLKNRKFISFSTMHFIINIPKGLS